VGRPLPIHFLKLLQRFNSSRDRATEFRPVRVARKARFVNTPLGSEADKIFNVLEKLVNMVCDDLFLMLSYIKPKLYVSPEYS
jgi:hypothetical protein